MKVTIPASQPYTGAKLYYVESETNEGDKYFVQRVGSKYFCQCDDFFIRRLPHFGTPAFSGCKHINEVKVLEILAKPVAIEKKYEVWCIYGPYGPFLSSTIKGGPFDSEEDAKRAIETQHMTIPAQGYEIREIKTGS